MCLNAFIVLRRYQWTTNTTLAFTRCSKLAQYSDENFPENREKPVESIGDGSQRGKYIADIFSKMSEVFFLNRIFVQNVF